VAWERNGLLARQLPYQLCDFIFLTDSIAATRWHILKLKCTKFDFGWSSAQETAGGAYSSPQLDFRGQLHTEGKGE